MAVKSISRSAIWQLIGKFAFQGIYFFTIPIFTRLLSPKEYGLTTLYASWLAIFSLIEGLCLYSSFGTARIKYGEQRLPVFLSSTMTMSVISFSLILSIFLVFSNFFSVLFGFDKTVLTLLVVHAFFSFVINFEICRLDVLKESKKSTFLTLFHTMLLVVVSLIAVFLRPDNKAKSFIYGQAFSTISIGVVVFVLVYARGKCFWNCEYNKYCLHFSVPLIFHDLGHIVFSQSDKIMLQRMCGAESVGVYGVVVALATVLIVIYNALNTAWIPFYFDYKHSNDINEILSHSKRYSKFFTLISIGFILLSFDVFKIIAPIEYHQGLNVIPFFVMSNYFGYMYLFPVNHEFYKEKTILIPMITFFAAILNIAVNFFLIPYYGMYGAAIGTLTAHFLLFLLHELTAKFVVKDFEYPANFYIPGFVAISFFTILAYFLKGCFIIRLAIAFLVAVYLLCDIKKNKSIF